MESDRSPHRSQTRPALRPLPPIAVGLCGVALLAGPSATVVGAGGPFALVTLPSLGAVTWSCATTKEMWGLSVRISPRSATTVVRFRAGGARAVRTLQPAERARFPTLRARRQRLHFVQATGAGVLRARVRVTFTARGAVRQCAQYAPPEIDVHVAPRG